MASTATVTGATGFIATELVAQLLRKGYDVRATVRSKKDPSRYSALTKLAEALPGTLTFFEADLTTPGSYDAAVAGSDYVFHVASPVFFTSEDPQRDIVDAAVNGTRNLLSSAIKAKDTVKRVVYTSSTVALVSGTDEDDGKTFTEADWNTKSTVAAGQAYFVSKVQAEKAAFEIAKAEGVDLVSVLPSHVVGPLLVNSSAFSVQWIKDLLEKGTVPAQFPIQVDVRDVAAAHIAAIETPAASGRYILSQPGPPIQTVAKWLQDRFPQYNINVSAENIDPAKRHNADAAKAQKELGLTFTPFQTSFIDAATTAIQLGIAKPQLKAAA